MSSCNNINIPIGPTGPAGPQGPPGPDGWMLDGNTEGAEKYFGTNDNFDVPLYTNNVKRGVFDKNGNFGFGIATGLTSRIDVLCADSTYYGLSIRNTTATANVVYGYKIRQENAGFVNHLLNGQIYNRVDVGGSVSFSNSAFTLTTSKVVSQAMATGAANYALYARGFSNNSGLSVDGDSNVGINNLTAVAKLDVKGSDTSDANFTAIFAGSTGIKSLQIDNAGGVYNLGPGSVASNLVLGKSSLRINTTGDENVVIGFEAGYNNIVGSKLTFLGYQAGRANTGSRNTFLGNTSGVTNTSGIQNVFVGMAAGATNTISSNSTFVGYQAGGAANADSQVALGYFALGNGGSTGVNTVAIGAGSLYANTSGEHNTGLGTNSGVSNTSGAYNSYFGYSAGFTNTTGSRNVMVGYKAGYFETGSDALYIDNAQRTDLADGKLKALIYGKFDALTANQQLLLNAQRISMRYLPTSSAGLTTGDLWNDSGTLKIA